MNISKSLTISRYSHQSMKLGSSALLSPNSNRTSWNLCVERVSMSCSSVSFKVATSKSLEVIIVFMEILPELRQCNLPQCLSRYPVCTYAFLIVLSQQCICCRLWTQQIAFCRKFQESRRLIAYISSWKCDDLLVWESGTPGILGVPT